MSIFSSINIGRGLSFTRHTALVLTCCLAVSPALATDGSTVTPVPSVDGSQELRAGERIYREGVLLSGEQLKIAVKGDVPVPGVTFACVSCHLRSGLGSYDEGVYTPPITGEKLFQPLPRLYKGMQQRADCTLPPLRQAYTGDTLIEALRSGRNPNGQLFKETMPRYLIDDTNARLLVAYLKSLSARLSPGVTATNIRFATVISEEVPEHIRGAMLASLNYYFNLKNNQINSFSNTRVNGAKSRFIAESMLVSRELALKSLSLSQWTLKGPPRTWRSQLEAYNSREPVFALLGGVVSGPWKPIHQFCEENRIPCLFPNTALPEVSETGWYTLYLSKGYHQEGESAARYLHNREDARRGKVVQIVRDSHEGDGLSSGFRQAWTELGQPTPVTVRLPVGKALDDKSLQRLLAKEKPVALIVWDNATALPALERLRREGRPGMIVLSARYTGDRIWTIKESLRDITYLTYPFDVLPGSATAASSGGPGGRPDPRLPLRRADAPLNGEAEKIAGLTSSLTELLTVLLMDLKGNYYRDALLDVAGMLPDQPYPLFGRIGLGTGQRFGSRGCYIVQLSHGDDPALVKKSGWETY